MGSFKLKTNTTIQTEKLFFAYQGTRENCCDNNVDSIKRAIADFNIYQKSIEAITWEDLKKSGGFIDKEILQSISTSQYFACDLTYLNHNVLFELGYAIALNKNIFIFLNEEIENAKINYQNFFLKNIKYSPFKNSKDILCKLQNKEFSNEHIANAIPKDKLTEENDIFYLENDSETQATIDLYDYINGLSSSDLKLKVKVSDPYEVDYKTLSYYFSNLLMAKSILFHMFPANYDNAILENAKNSFLAGIACGLNKKVLLIAPAKFRSPLDYADILMTYTSSEDCITKVNQWIKKHCVINISEEISNEESDKNDISEINILKVALECTAENEKENLSNYFVSTSAYEKAKENKSKLLLVGRKGAGKTAIYYKLIEDLSEDSKNYNINLKPDSLELLENIDFSALYKSESSKKTFFYTVWKTVIYSKLIQTIKSKIIEKTSDRVILSEEENKILDFCYENENLIKQNFFGIIKELSMKISEHTIDTPQILEDLYKNYLSPLTTLLKRFFENHRYTKLNILSDNLDKSWNPKSNLDLQSNMILTLLEVDSQIKNELSNDKKDNITVLNYIFLREDIYNYISKEANEPDKLRTIVYKINWEDSPLKLKELVELKLNHILGHEDEQTNTIWKDFFDVIEKNKSPFDIIKDIIILRPRDIIFFIQALFESAANNNKNKVTKEDFEYAINQYTEFLNGNLIAEMKAEYPDIQEILNIFQLYKIMKYRDYSSKLKGKFDYNDKDIHELTETLFKNRYLMAFDKTSKRFYTTYKELETGLAKRRFFIVPHNILLFVNNPYINYANMTPKRMFGLR